ncbi:MAG: hypothetical protein U0939_16185 [Pirellulales bacterium]
MKCETGYLCDVCGRDVERLSESDLYLRYVVGMVDPEVLHVSADRHIRCNPVLAQFIVDADFTPAVVVEGDFDKRLMDARFVAQREELVTRGWRRLAELAGSELAVVDYPLPEVRGASRSTAWYG